MRPSLFITPYSWNSSATRVAHANYPLMPFQDGYGLVRRPWAGCASRTFAMLSPFGTSLKTRQCGHLKQSSPHIPEEISHVKMVARMLMPVLHYIEGKGVLLDTTSASFLLDHRRAGPLYVSIDRVCRDAPARAVYQPHFQEILAALVSLPKPDVEIGSRIITKLIGVGDFDVFQVLYSLRPAVLTKPPRSSRSIRNQTFFRISRHFLDYMRHPERSQLFHLSNDHLFMWAINRSKRYQSLPLLLLGIVLSFTRQFKWIGSPSISEVLQVAAFYSGSSSSSGQV